MNHIDLAIATALIVALICGAILTWEIVNLKRSKGSKG